MRASATRRQQPVAAASTGNAECLFLDRNCLRQARSGFGTRVSVGPGPGVHSLGSPQMLHAGFQITVDLAS